MRLARIHIYLSIVCRRETEQARETERETERRQRGELVLCFLRWHTKICAKGLLLTNERAGKKCGRIALFFSLSCSQAVEREKRRGGEGEDNRHKPARTQTCTCAPQTHARGKDMPCVSWQRICFARFIRICRRLRMQTAEDDEPQITICTRTSDALSPSAAGLVFRSTCLVSCRLPAFCLLTSLA